VYHHVTYRAFRPFPYLCILISYHKQYRDGTVYHEVVSFILDLFITQEIYIGTGSNMVCGYLIDPMIDLLISVSPVGQLGSFSRSCSPYHSIAVYNGHAACHGDPLAHQF
jgi:hypothetical protein